MSPISTPADYERRAIRIFLYFAWIYGSVAAVAAMDINAATVATLGAAGLAASCKSNAP